MIAASDDHDDDGSPELRSGRNGSNSRAATTAAEADATNLTASKSHPAQAVPANHPLIQELPLQPPQAAATTERAVGGGVPAFTFTHRPASTALRGFTAPGVQESLFKWGMKDSCRLTAFSFDAPLVPLQADSFLLDFFNDENVRGVLKVLDSNGRWITLPPAASAPATAVRTAPCTATVTSLDFFDPLYDH
ncbi:hypothetical protein HK405_004134, partial [Cladochytrium tenue]